MWSWRVELVEVVTVADVDDKDHVGNSLLQGWKMRFIHKAKLLFRLWAQGLVKILGLSLVEMKFDQDLCKSLWYEFKKFCWLLLSRIQPWGPLCLWQCFKLKLWTNMFKPLQTILSPFNLEWAKRLVEIHHQPVWKTGDDSGLRWQRQRTKTLRE